MTDLKKIFKNLLEFDTDAEYRKHGTYHFSPLSNIFQKEQYELDPTVKQAISDAIGKKPVVVAGHAFEDYYEKGLLAFDKYDIATSNRPPNMLGTLTDFLVTDKVNPEDAQRVAETIKTYGLFKSDKSEAAKTNRALLPFDVKQYVNEQRLMSQRPEKVLKAQTKISIIESLSVLKKRYASILDDKDSEYFFQVPLHDSKNDVTIMIDMVRIKGKQIWVYDTKFKDGDAAEWLKTFWKYGYWIQSVLYTRTVQNNLFSGMEFMGFFFVVGSNSHPENSRIVAFPTDKVQTLYEDGITTASGFKFPAIRQLMAWYDFHVEYNLWEFPAEFYMNDMIEEPTFPKSV
jgi:hypothetical protein